jgi:hypothetical protein
MGSFEAEAKRLKRDDTALVVIDVQEKLLPAMYERDALLESTVKLVQGCAIIGVPSIFTQQYTKGLGMTVPALVSAAGKTPEAFDYIDKSAFAATSEPSFLEALEASGRFDGSWGSGVWGLCLA